MGALRTVLAAVCLVVAVPAGAESVADWRPYIAEASTRFGVPTAWIEAVMQAESRGRTQLNGRPIRSSAGAIGLMQLMPVTWAEMRTRLGLGNNPDDPRDNVLAGTLYLRLMYDRFGYPGLFAAYNAGPGRYAEHLADRRALPDETLAYMGNVTGTSPAPGQAVEPLPPPSLFALRRDVAQPASGEVQPSSPSMLFVALSQGK